MGVKGKYRVKSRIASNGDVSVSSCEEIEKKGNKSIVLENAIIYLGKQMHASVKDPKEKETKVNEFKTFMMEMMDKRYM
jgi:hypothetical protein